MDDFADDKPRSKFIESEAGKIIKSCGILSAPINLKEVVSLIQKTYNVDLIKSSELEDGLSGFLAKGCDIYDEEFYKIGFNANHPWVRNRFTIGHEVGHMILGHVCDKSSTNKTNEKEADLFAANLLMPKSILKKDFTLTPSHKELAKKYIVSESAMMIRLMQTRILSFK